METRAWKAAIWLVLPLLGGCNASDGSIDAGGPDTGGAIEHNDGSTSQPGLELGSSVDAFVPVAEGDTLGLQRGTQGLQHVWVSLRIRDMDPARATIELSLSRESDGYTASEPFRVRLPFATDPGWDYAERIGMQLVVLEPEAVLGQDLILTARVTDSHEVSVERRTRVHVVWEEELGGGLP